MAGRGFSGSVPVGTPVFVNVTGTKTTSLLDSYGKRNAAESIDIVDSSGISRTIIGPYQIPSDATKSWYLDVWDGEAKVYRTLLIPSSTIFDVTDWSPSSQTTQLNVITNEPPAGVINGTNRAFSLANSPIANSVVVSINGMQLQPGQANDYTLVSKTIIFAVAPTPGDIILVDYCR